MGKEMVVNFVNTNYPENDITDADCEFRLVITNPDICQVCFFMHERVIVMAHVILFFLFSLSCRFVWTL